MDNALCLNSNTYHGFELADAVAGARAAGLEFIEIAAVRGHTEHLRADMSDDELASALQLLRENGIRPLGLSGHANIMTEEGRASFRQNIELAERIGASYIVTGTGDTHDDEDVIEDEAALVDILRDLTAYAAERGIRVALETHGNNYGTGASIRDLATKVGSDDFGVNYDTANVIFYGDVYPYDDLEQSADRVLGIHLKDKAGEPREWNFPAIGDGDLDFGRIFDILRRTACIAPLSIEIEFTAEGPASLDEVHAAVARSVATIAALR